MSGERDYAAELRALQWDSEIIQAYWNRHNDPWLEAAVAMDADYQRTGEHPLLRVLRTREAEPILRNAGSPEGTNDMRYTRPARDQSFARNDGVGRYGVGPTDLEPRGSDQEGPEPNNKMDCKTLIGLVELCLRGLDDPGERSEFLGELAQLLAGSEHMTNGGNGDGIYDQTMMGTMPSSAPPPPAYSSRPTGDRRRGRNGARGASDRAIAMDSVDSAVRSLNARAFQRRWNVGHITLAGHGGR
jgi:hypothetical protein